VAEAPGGGPGVQADQAGGVNAEVVQGRGQLLASPADVRGGRRRKFNGRVLRHQGPGLGHRHAVHPHPPCQDQGLGLGPGVGQSQAHQKVIQPGFGGFGVLGSGFWVFHCKGCSFAGWSRPGQPMH
jgi:hypothetical protein